MIFAMFAHATTNAIHTIHRGNTKYKAALSNGSHTIFSSGNPINISPKTPMAILNTVKIYVYSTSFNEQVKNNIEKFDYDFMFELTKEELADMMNSFVNDEDNG